MTGRRSAVLLGVLATAAVVAAGWLLIHSIDVEADAVEQTPSGDASLYGVGYIVIVVLLGPPGLMLLISTLLGAFSHTALASSVFAVVATVVLVPLSVLLLTWGDSDPDAAIPADALDRINRLIDLGQVLLLLAALLAVAHAATSVWAVRRRRSGAG